MNKFADMIKDKTDIMIICHIRPDGDTVGSAFALYHALKSLNKNPCVVCSHPITPKYHYISGKGELSLTFAPQLVISVDIASASLIGEKYKDYADKVDISIDHHSTGTPFAKYNIINTKAAATGEVIFELLKQLNIQITNQIALCLYTAISTDTGCFKYSNTTANTLRIAADLVEILGNVGEVNNMLFEKKSINQIHLENAVYSNLKYYENNEIAFVAITSDMINSAGASDDDVDGISALTRQIEGVKIGVTARQVGKDEYKISLRSTSPFDVSAVAAKFQGGGHVRAAGCSIHGDIDEVEHKIVAQAIKELKRIEA